MGLDMYLEARKYVAKIDWSSVPEGSRSYSSYTTPEYSAIVSTLPEGIDEFGDVSGAQVSVTIGYWRKANAIHNWFVEKCAGGEDKCQDIYVYQDKLIELSALVNEVLENPEKGKELLPTASGFFFGSTEYDEWYIRDLERTKSILDKALALDDGEFDIVYRASW